MWYAVFFIYLSIGSIFHSLIRFYIFRFVFKSSTRATGWAHRNKYFNILSRGVERDGWKFVLLARFSPIPSYVINYALAATEVRFVADFLFPTVIGCLPMILQNASVGSLAGMAVASVAGKQKSQIWGYVFPVLGILSSVLISLRIKKYSAGITETSSDTSANSSSLASSSETSNPTYGTDGSKKSEWLYKPWWWFLIAGNTLCLVCSYQILNIMAYFGRVRQSLKSNRILVFVVLS